MIYGLVAALLVIAALGLGVTRYGDNREAQGRATLQAQIDVKDKELADKAAALERETANHVADMATAYEVGEKDADAKRPKIINRGAADVKKYPVFSNPACVLPADSLRQLNSARAGVRSAADPAGAVDPVRPAESGIGRKPSGPLPTDAGGRGRTLGPVHPKAR